MVFAAAACVPAVLGGSLIEDIPDELVQEMKAAHPSMRQLMGAAERRLLQDNATNATDAADAVPLETPLAGTSYSCVSRREYRAMAMDPLLSKDSRQYTDGNFFCEGYVDYAAACDLLKPKKSCNNKYAEQIYKHFETALSVFSCKQYSTIWTCQNCKKAYKRWLCSQVYRKYIIPDTEYVELGEVSKGSFRCQCPFPNPELEAVSKDQEADTNPPCIRVCNGMPRQCEVVAGQTKPTCPRPTCGGAGTAASPGMCLYSVYLDSTSSGMDDFYVGARLEMTTKNKMTAWWADIEEYDGFTKLAMFRKWNKPYGKEADPEEVPTVGDTYRLFLTDSMRGMCRDPKTPKVRMGSPCEQQQVFQLGDAISTGPSLLLDKTNALGEKTCLDGSPYDDGTRCAAPGGLLVPAAEAAADAEGEEAAAATTIFWKDGWRGPQKTDMEAPPYQYPLSVKPDLLTGSIEPVALGGTRCPDTDICVTVPKRNDSEPLASPFGFACCPRSGYDLQIVTGESWNVYQPTDNANLSTGDLNYTCVYKTGDSFDNALLADEAPPIGARSSVQATIALSATLSSGCLHNNTATSDVATDDCVMKTCKVVCHDVARKCPRKIEFGCPDLDDYREYEDTMCNVAVPQGCLLKVEDQLDGSVNCVDMNPTGYGPMFYTNPEMDASKREVFKSSGGKWLSSPSAVFGLPEEPSCLGVDGLSLDIGKDFRDNRGLNRPTNGPATAAGINSTVDIWCADEGKDSPLRLHPDDVGCREIYYAGYHDIDCYKKSEGNRKGAVAEET